MRTGKEHTDDGSTRYVTMKRAEDSSMWVKSAYVLEKYKILVWLVIAFLIAMGFQWKTPAMIVNGLQNQITENKEYVDKVVKPQIDSLTENSTVLLKLQCIDTKITQQQRSLVGLNCTKLFNEKP